MLRPGANRVNEKSDGDACCKIAITVIDPHPRVPICQSPNARAIQASRREQFVAAYFDAIAVMLRFADEKADDTRNEMAR